MSMHCFGVGCNILLWVGCNMLQPTPCIYLSKLCLLLACSSQLWLSELLTDTPNKRALEEEHAVKAVTASKNKNLNRSKRTIEFRQVPIKQKRVMKPQSKTNQPVPSQSSSRINFKNKRKAKHNKPCKRRILDKTYSEESDSQRNYDDDGKGFVYRSHIRLLEEKSS